MTNEIYQLRGRNLTLTEESILEQMESKKVFLKNAMGEMPFYEKRCEFSSKVSEAYPQIGALDNQNLPLGYRNFMLYHVLIGSTPDRSWNGDFDFPGENSVAKFIDHLHQEYSIREKESALVLD